LFLLVSEEITNSGFDGLLPAGIVIVGGTAQLSGIEELGTDVTGLPVRKGTPKGVHGLVDAIGDPAYATAVGLALWGARNGDGALSTYPAARGDERSSSDARRVSGRLFGWLRTILP
jgi:cell division protein FtsA